MFRVDGVIDGIEYMVTDSHGTIENLLCRKRWEGKTVYTRVTWTGTTGQMTRGKWCASGRTATAIEYVASGWVDRP